VTPVPAPAPAPAPATAPRSRAPNAARGLGPACAPHQASRRAAWCLCIINSPLPLCSAAAPRCCPGMQSQRVWKRKSSTTAGSGTPT
jgi:hypothetical protein